MNRSSSARQNVLVHRTGHLGDTVCAIPAFRLIRRFLPDARLTLLCDRPRDGRTAAAAVVGSLGLFDDIRDYASRRGLRTLWELAWAVRGSRPDLVILLPQVDESAANIRRKIRFFRSCGAPDVRGHNFPVLRHAWQPTESERLVQILHSIGVRGEKPAYDIPVDEAAQKSVQARLRAVGVEPGRPFLLFCGGGKHATQRWPLERYAAVLGRLAAESSRPVVALGTSRENGEYRRTVLPRFAGLKLLDGSLGIPEMFELSRMAAAYLGNDTGPMHVAAAVGCPVAVVMSGRNPPGAWDPDASFRHVIRLRVECEACFLTECVAERHRCMTGLTEEKVTTEVRAFLDRLPAREAARSF